MADAVSGAAGKAAMGMFGPHPSITIVTFWQGILEIVLRGIGVVSSLLTSVSSTNMYGRGFSIAIACVVCV